MLLFARAMGNSGTALPDRKHLILVEHLLSNPSFRSLRFRLLVPQIVVSLATAVVVAAGSYALGSVWARQQVERRFEGMKSTLSRATFPLTETVLHSIAELTQSEMITLDATGEMLATTLPSDKLLLRAGQFNDKSVNGNRDGDEANLFQVGNDDYLSYRFPMVGIQQGTDPTRTVVVLFAKRDLQAARLRAAILPLLTGLSTVVLLTTLSLTLTERLIKRLSLLQQKVEAVAAGDFSVAVIDDRRDEVGLLGLAVNSMAQQLRQLWQAVNRQQSDKLLHQIAAGMAHQLRNNLTGARLAIELHAKHCSQNDEGLQVAIQQLDQLEDYVRRLLLVGMGQQDEHRPTEVMQCLSDVQSSVGPIAQHLRVAISWKCERQLQGKVVQDGPSLSSAISNLVFNALQAGTCVEVIAEPEGAEGCLKIVVSDNGPGINPDIANNIFEPFVTTKREGLGLGLPHVQRAAAGLGGSVEWSRVDGWTHFTFRAAMT